MSYWSDNPEKWDEIICQGISHYLTGDRVGPVRDELYANWCDDPALRPALVKLTELASKEIQDAEQDYWSIMSAG